MRNRPSEEMDTFIEEERSLLTTNTRGGRKYENKEKRNMGTYQSLDFTPIDNKIFHEYNRRHTKWSDYYIVEGGKWMLCFWIGIILGCCAFLVKYSVEHLNELKFELTEHYMEHHGKFVGFAVYAGFNVVLAFGASLIILIVRQPLSGGSGIPEVKAYLNGVRIPGSLNIRTLIGKLVSIILSFSAGLILGPEGPMIHIGSMVGAAVGQVKSKSMKWYPKMFWRYHNDRDRRDFISSGAAAGVAAAFGAPIGGTLFSIEEASSFWSPQLTWRTFFTCLVASITISAFQNGGDVMLKDHGILFFGLSQLYLYRMTEIFSFAILGALGGLASTLFVVLNLKLNMWRGTKLKHFMLRVIEVIVAALFTSAVLYWLSMVFPCNQLANIQPSNDGCNSQTKNTTVIIMACPEGYYSDMATLLFTPPENALQVLYSRSQNVISMPALAVACVVFFILAVLTSGLLVAGGLFIPMMLIGATLGRFFGRVLSLMFSFANPPLDSSVYALVGTAAVMGGFSRMTIALVVIIVELTESTQYLLPIILSVMVSKWVGDSLTEAHYEHLMETKWIPYLETSPPQAMIYFTVTEIMHRNVVEFNMTEKVSDVVAKLRQCQHSGFPVVERVGPGRSVFRGSILRSQISVLLMKKLFGSAVAVDDNQPQMSVVTRLTYEDCTEELAKTMPPIDQIAETFTSQELSMYIDLSPYANMSATVVHDTCSYMEAYRLFRTMGLRHLFVINKANEVVGVITRKDLL